MRPVSLMAPDGVVLQGQWAIASEPRAVVVLAGALGVPAAFYRRFAVHLASSGLSVLTFDYRGAGASRTDPAVASRATLRQWGEDDLAAALDEAEREARGAPVVLLGHSFGGQALALAPVRGRVAGAVIVGAQLGWVGHFPAPARWALAGMFQGVVPAVSARMGYTPGWLGLGIDLPTGVVAEWGRWMRSPRYLLDHVPQADLALQELGFRVEMIAPSDDRYAPIGAVRALASAIPTAELTVIEPGAVGLREIGHFGLFRPTCSRLWDPVADRLVALAGVAPALRAA